MSRSRGKTRRRRQAGSRREHRPVLLTVQGETTEVEYFKRLQKEYRIPALKIKAVPKSWDEILRKTKAFSSNASYDDVFMVVDVDDFPVNVHAKAKRNCRALDFGTKGSPGSTAMPKLLAVLLKK